MNICEFCNKTVSTKYVLKSHQKSKNCLKIQKEKGITIPIIDNFDCTFCQKSFTRVDSKQRHENVCKKKNIIETNNLKEENLRLTMKNVELNVKIDLYKEMNDKFEKMASKPRVNNTVNVFGNVDLSEQNLNSKLLCCYDESVFDKGPAGFADLVREKVLTNEKGESLYDIADKSRKVIKYNIDGNLVRDEKASFLKDKVITTVKTKMKDIKKKKFDLVCRIEDNEEEEEDRYISNISNVFKCNLSDEKHDFVNRLMDFKLSGGSIEGAKILMMKPKLKDGNKKHKSDINRSKRSLKSSDEE